jgi:predicted DNA binding CopG/RHH family protein
MVEGGESDMENINGKIIDRLGAAMAEAKRIEADMAEAKASQLKTKAIQINFNEVELERLKQKADANCLKLQDYIRMILTTYG